MSEEAVQEKSSNQDSINRLKMMLGQDASPEKTPKKTEANSSPLSPSKPAEAMEKSATATEGLVEEVGTKTTPSGDSPMPTDVFDFSSFPTEPVPLILPEVDANGREELVVQKEALALLRRIAVPVVVLAVSGLYRSGKSSLLNWLCNPEINSDLFQTSSSSTLAPQPPSSEGSTSGGAGFAVGATVMRCTRGIWLWGRPRVVTLNDGSQGALIVMDTEGLGGMDAGAAYDARVFSLSALLCSTMLYNSLGTIDEKAISSLSFVADLARNIRLEPTDTNNAPVSPQANTSKGVKSEGKNDLSDLGPLFPSFVWVLRDFALDLVDDDGETLNAEQYLDQCLRPQQGYDAGVAERNKIRRALTTFFQNRTCCTLVRPLHNEEQLQQVDQVKWAEFRPEFTKDFRVLQETLLHVLKPKFTAPPKNSGGVPRPMNGQMYATLIGEYVRAVNSEGAPVVATAWEQVTANECIDASSTAFSQHRELLSSFAIPMDASQAAALHAAALYTAIRSYDERAEGKNASTERELLQNRILQAYEEWCGTNESASSSHCRQLINKLYQTSPLYVFENEQGHQGGRQTDDGTNVEPSSEEAQELVISSLPHDEVVDAIERTWQNIIQEYWTSAKGPKSEFELLEFMKVKWACLAKKVLLVMEGKTAKEANSAESSLVEARRLAAQMKSENDMHQSEIATSTELVAKYKLELDKTKESLKSAIENEKRAKEALKGEVKKRRDLESKGEDVSEDNSRLQQELKELKASTEVLEAEKQHLADRLEAIPPFEEKGPACCILQ